MRTPGPIPTDNFVANVMYQLYNLSLSQFTRAQAVGRAYREFRIANVKFVFKPLFDTYQAGSPGSLPYLYYLVDRTGSYQNIVTVEQMKRMGAVGRRLDDRTITVNYRPSVLTKTYDSQDGGASQNNQYRISPWMSTNDAAPSGAVPFTPSGVDHLGLKWSVQQDGGSAPFRIELQVEFQFRKAYIDDVVNNPLTVVDVFPTDETNTTEDLTQPPPS